MRHKFDQQLNKLNNKLILMGCVCEELIDYSINTLDSLELNQTDNIKDATSNAKDIERKIENLCFKILLQQHPVACDLRNVSAALKIATDLKRISVQAQDICDIVEKNNLNINISDELNDNKATLKKMGESAKACLRLSIDSYVRMNLEIANKAIEADNVIDEQFRENKLNIIKLIKSESKNAEIALELLMIAKYYERIGDHAVNVAKKVKFLLENIVKEDIDE